MNIKSISYIVTTAVLLIAGTSSCSLEEVNKSNVSTDQEWKTPEGYQKKVIDCYNYLSAVVYGHSNSNTYMFNAECGTDIWQDTPRKQAPWSFVHRYEGDMGRMTGEGYQGFYATINACNGAILYADKVEGMAQDEINALVAEAYFLRAHSLYNIVEVWGGKYLPTEPTSKPISSLECSKVNDFYEVILNDLRFAMKNLPVTQPMRGRIIRAAAYHLYAKACLTYASYTDGLGNCTPISEAECNELLREAKNSADYLIDNAAALGVGLYTDVRDVFDENNNKNNKEALYIVTHTNDESLWPHGKMNNYPNRVWRDFAAYSNQNFGIYLEGLTPLIADEVNGKKTKILPPGNMYIMPSKYLIDLYVDKDMRYDAFFNDVYYINKANNSSKTAYNWSEADAKRFNLDLSRVDNPDYELQIGDTAIYLSRNTLPQAERDKIHYAYVNLSDNYADEEEPGAFFPSLIKHDAPKYYIAGSKPTKVCSYADQFIYRLGETYLLSAEIDWRLGQVSADRINALRNRACLNHDGSLNVSASDINQDFLLDEYAREMCGEWNRWMTLKRFRAFESRLSLNKQIKAFDKTKHYVRPVANWVITAIENGSEYQNPGY